VLAYVCSVAAALVAGPLDIQGDVSLGIPIDRADMSARVATVELGRGDADADAGTSDKGDGASSVSESSSKCVACVARDVYCCFSCDQLHQLCWCPSL
jgi:hypothetical protein